MHHALRTLPSRAVLLAITLDAGSLPAQSEPFPPLYHFAPARNRINHPNELVSSDGEWHLFYQYNPFGDMLARLTRP